MILEKHEFELQESTYIWIFFQKNTYYSTTQSATESLDVESWIWRTKKVIHGFFTMWSVSVPNPHVVQGSIVYFILKDIYLNQWKNRVLPLEQYKNALYYHTRGISQCNHTGKKNERLKNWQTGTSLMVQWASLHVSNAEGLGLILGWGTRSHMHAVTKSLHAETKSSKPQLRAHSKNI